MAFGGRELRLFLSIQSYGTTNIARLRRDIAGLQTMTEAVNKRQLAQARLAQRAVRVGAAEAELRAVRAGIPAYEARNKLMNQWGRANASVMASQGRQMSINRQLFDLETKRQSIQRKLFLGKERGMPVPDMRLLERGLESVAMQEGILNQNSKALTATLAVQRTTLETLTNEYKELVADKGAASAASLKAKANLDVETAAYRRQAIAVAQAEAAIRAIPLDKLEQTGRRIAHIGRTAQFTGLLMTAGFSMAATSAANFSEKLYLAATQTGNVSAGIPQILANVKRLEHGFKEGGREFDGILDLMQQFPATADEMAEAAYDIYSSMNISFGQGLRLLKNFNQVAVATGGTLEDATSAGITVLNNFGKASGNVDTVLNLMIATIRFGRMHLAEFNAMLEKVAPAAASAGQRFQDVAGAMALLTTRQPSQRVSATGIARLLQTFQDPDFQRGLFNISDGLVDITKGQGAVGVLKPLPDIIDQMAKSFGLFQKFGGPQQLFKELTATGAGRGVGRQSRIEAWKAYTFLIENLEDYRDLQSKVTGDTTEFARALAIMSGAPGVRWKVFLNQMRAFIIIIGEEALPALLTMAGWVSKVVKGFQGLSDTTRHVITSFAVWAGVAFLVGGTLMNIGGSVLALIANFKILQMQKLANLQIDLAATGNAAQIAAVKTSMLMKSMLLLGGITAIAIPIAIQLLRGGDPGLWTLLSAAGMGAIGGAQIGAMFGQPLAGAAVGALAVPLVIKLIADIQAPEDPVKKAYDDYKRSIMKQEGGFGSWIKKTMAPFGAGAGVARVVPEAMPFQEWLRAHPKFLKQWNEAHKKRNNGDKSAYEKALSLADEFNKEYIDKLMGNQKKLNDAWEKQNAGAVKASQDAGKALQDAAQIAQVRTDAIAAAHENMEQKITSAVDKLMQTYDQFKQANEQALGSIFQGPVMGGVLGNVFTQINDQMRQFGVQIPVPFELLRQDFDMQLAYFKRWRADLDKLAKRGAPLKFIQEMQKLGPEKGIPIVEGLLSGSKGQFKGIVKEWEASQKLIHDATKQDMDAQLDDWMKHGKNIALQIILGVRSEQVALEDGFRRYIVGTFGRVLKAGMTKEVAEAVAKAVKDLAASNALEAAIEAAGAAAAANVPTTAGQGATAPKGLRLPQIAQQLKGIDAKQLAIWQNIQRTRPGQGPNAAEMAQLRQLQKRETNLENARRDYLAQERRSVSQQIQAQRKKPGEETHYTITYQGDTVTVKADGATVASVMRALNKKKFQRQARMRTKRGQRR